MLEPWQVFDDRKRKRKLPGCMLGHIALTLASFRSANVMTLATVKWPFCWQPIAQDKKGGKSVYDDVSEKKKKSDTDPTYSENMKLSIKIMERALT